ncbi:MAG TPA: cellulase family glycosylhydrolase [Candidatus Paceibacterota bacterium]|nr:cellulase family glycosylhydrolase [Candidatus Paceibacterota bacterium]
MPVVAPIAQNPATADTTPLAIDTSTPNPIDTSTKATLSDATKPLGGLYTPVAPLPHRIGMAMGSQLTGLNDTDLEKEVSGMQAMGVKIVRYDIDWGFVQQNSASQYDWSKYDRIANSLKKHGIVGLGIIINTPPWARTAGCTGGAHCPPNDPNQFATFATALVNRYKSYGMHYWEIWNEENDYDFWATKSDCGAYTTLLKAVYPAIKKADPGAYVITGGLAQVANTNVNIAPLDFLQCVYKDGGKNYFDAVGYHPYTFPALPSANSTNAWAGMSNGNPSVRSIMNANGDSAKQIWITEYGAPTNGPDSKWYLSEDQQSKMVTDTINLYKSYSWAGPLFWYTYRDGGTTTDTNENFFGLVRNDYSQKPAYQTMQGFLSSGLN